MRKFGPPSDQLRRSAMLAWVFLWIGETVVAHAAAARPNVLFIAIDDLRPAMGAYGDPLARTPHLDRLAHRGLVFERAYCQHALCAPSRASVMTGRRPERFPKISGGAQGAHYREVLPDVVTLPQLFKQHGYHTESIGKVNHVYPPLLDPISWSVPERLADIVKRDEYLRPENRVGGFIDPMVKGEATESIAAPDSAYVDGQALLEYDWLVEPLPNRKASWNRPQLPGRSFAYVTGDSAARRRIRDEHWDATIGLLHFLQTDSEVPLDVRRKWGEFGLARDEFADHAHRPYELYVREGRRIIGRQILTEHDTRLSEDFERAPIHADSIGVTEWYVDIHVCGADRIGDSFGDGKMMLYVETVPGHVPYGALLPRGIENLLAPVCLSATHVAFSAVRLEPTWMAVGEAAGFAAAQAVRTARCPAELDTEVLQRTLAARGVMLTFFNDVEVATAGGATPNAAAQFFGTKGFLPDYDARLAAPLSRGLARVWAVLARDLAGKNANDIARKVLAAERDAPESIDRREFAALFPPRSSVQPDAIQSIARGTALGALWGTLQPAPN